MLTLLLMYICGTIGSLAVLWFVRPVCNLSQGAILRLAFTWPLVWVCQLGVAFRIPKVIHLVIRQAWWVAHGTWRLPDVPEAPAEDKAE